MANDEDVAVGLDEDVEPSPALSGFAGDDDGEGMIRRCNTGRGVGEGARGTTTARRPVLANDGSVTFWGEGTLIKAVGMIASGIDDEPAESVPDGWIVATVS